MRTRGLAAIASPLVLAVADWVGPVEDITVISGPHSAIFVADSAEECQKACRGNSTCTGWTWHKTSDTCKGGTNPNQVKKCYHLTTMYLSPQTCPGHVSGYLAPPLAKPNQRQLEFMDMELSQFMHFGIPTFWDPPADYLYGDNPTYHDCHTTSIDHSNQTGDWYPCLDPMIFNPTDLNADDWMAASTAMGMKEIVLTAHHEGGFALWPSKFTNYSVALSKNWKGGRGDVLREFADAANRWGIKIAYYLNVQDDGYQNFVVKASPEDFIQRQIGMVHEVLTQYGPVNRFWFDGTKSVPEGTNVTDLWNRVYHEIRTTSPGTMISSYRGDVCSSTGSLYTNQGPLPNTTDPSNCKGPFSESGPVFHPTEMHGITIQEGKDGNSNEKPTYWFWHDWACAGNVSGCPWIGHANASRVFDSILVTVGHGAVLNMNIPPDRTGRMNASVAAVMREVGDALNSTFGKHVSKATAVKGACAEGVVELELPHVGAPIDYIVTMEELSEGQRIANYSVEFQRSGASKWETLVPPVQPTPSLQDRPDGHDPRDQYVGHKRIDIPEWPDSAAKDQIQKVRFTCLRSIQDLEVNIRSFALHKRDVPWERSIASTII